jgi:hypothetical protein
MKSSYEIFACNLYINGPALAFADFTTKKGPWMFFHGPAMKVKEVAVHIFFALAGETFSIAERF